MTSIEPTNSTDLKHILGLDPGYGDIKVVYGNSRGEISKLYKFNSVVAKISTNAHVKDLRVHEYKGSHYYIGQDALALESSKVLDLLTYDNLEYFSPLLARSIIDSLPSCPDIIVAGLSIAHIEHSGYFKSALEKYLIEECKYPIKKILVVPQGIGGKVAYDTYGSTFPSPTKDFAANTNYIGIDIGFNTLDIFQVINNKTTSNLIRGIENSGVVQIVSKLLAKIESMYDRKFTIKEGKDILDRREFKIRGTVISVENIVNDLKTEYLKYIQDLIEKEFGAVLDKADKMRLFGGGSYIFRSHISNFIEVPERDAEFYNAIGQYKIGTLDA